MNKNIITYVTVATLAFIPMVTFAADPSVGSSFSTADPSTGSSFSTADPSTGSSDSTANPPTGGSASTAAAAGSTGGGSTGGSTGSSGSSSGSGSYVGGGRSFVSYCTLITSYMRLGGNNDSAQVTKLQNFLKNTEKLDVDVSGIFDTKTETAVKAFQNKYSAETMAPWGATEGNGYVFMTTVKKINQIACGQPLTLNASELATINSYRSGNRSVNSSVPTIKNVEVKVTPASIEVENDQDKDVEVGNTNENTNTASVGSPSVLKRFWNFVLFLFR